MERGNWKSIYHGQNSTDCPTVSWRLCASDTAAIPLSLSLSRSLYLTHTHTHTRTHTHTPHHTTHTHTTRTHAHTHTHTHTTHTHTHTHTHTERDIILYALRQSTQEQSRPALLFLSSLPVFCTFMLSAWLQPYFWIVCQCVFCLGLAVEYICCFGLSTGFAWGPRFDMLRTNVFLSLLEVFRSWKHS